MTPRVGVVTQARTSSTRLPGKVLEQVGGTTLIEHQLDRLARSGLEVFVATTTNTGDDPLAAIAQARGLGVHRGSEQDVLARFSGCARAHDLDVVVRVTSDCPLIDGDLVARGIEEWLAAGDPDLYLSNCLVRTFPRGFDFEVFGAQALHEANAAARSPEEREHVTPYLHRNAGGRTTLRNLAHETDESRYRVTVDTAADLALVRVLIETYGAHRLDCEGILDVLRAHPELVELNAAVAQKELDATEDEVEC